MELAFKIWDGKILIWKRIWENICSFALDDMICDVQIFFMFAHNFGNLTLAMVNGLVNKENVWYYSFYYNLLLTRMHGNSHFSN